MATRVRHRPIRAAGRMALAALSGVVLAACAVAATETGVHEGIVAEIGEARCTADAQCKVLPIGAKPCGGPRSYLAWSTAASDGAKLKAWSDQLAALQRQEQQRRGEMSDCSIVPEPAVACVQQRCVLRPGGRGNLY